MGRGRQHRGGSCSHCTDKRTGSQPRQSALAQSSSVHSSSQLTAAMMMRTCLVVLAVVAMLVPTEVLGWDFGEENHLLVREAATQVQKRLTCILGDVGLLCSLVCTLSGKNGGRCSQGTRQCICSD